MKRKLEQNIFSWLSRNTSHPLLLHGARRTGKTTLAEMVGREHAGEYFVKLDFQTDVARCDAIFSGATDDLDSITANIAAYLRCDLDRDWSMLLFDEVQLDEKALDSLRFFSESRAPRAYRLSEQNFSKSTIAGTDCTLAGLPLYAAFTLGR